MVRSLFFDLPLFVEHQIGVEYCSVFGVCDSHLVVVSQAVQSLAVAGPIAEIHFLGLSVLVEIQAGVVHSSVVEIAEVRWLLAEASPSLSHLVRH